MEHFELLRYAVTALERLGLPYFVTGSTATTLLGEPRFTNDIDVVVNLPAAKVAAFCAEFPSDQFYVSDEAAHRAIRLRSQFNIIHPASGLKLDIMVPADTAFNRSRFARTQRMRIAPDCDAAFTSAEDAILKKMEFFRDGASDKHLRDIAGVIKVSGERLDTSYIEEWSARLGLEEIWQMIQERLADPG